MPAYAVIGGQWGDEGKGKIIDYLAGKADAVVRYAGGSNAGHTVVNDKGTFQLHMVPSGICWPGAYGIIGNGVVVDPDVLLGELNELASRGIDTSRLCVSERAHLIMPYHVLLDRLEEEARGADAIGTTGRGVGPAYVDKTARAGIRVGDLLDLEGTLLPRLRQALTFKNDLITKIYGGEPLSLKDVLAKCYDWAERLRPYIMPTEQIIQDLLDQDKAILLEGAQGTLLDIDHGSYPYVTSSSSSIGGACVGLGLNPQSIVGVVGVFKAYSTRVGEGPMPSEMHGEMAEGLREKAQEYGTTTGRPRRVGWFDGVAAKYSRLVNGMTGFVLTRLDILDGFDSVKVCVGYQVDGQELDRFPSNTSLLAQCQPVYEEHPGWDQPTASATSLSQLPANAIAYVKRIEELVGCRAQIISTGPSREETIQVEPVIP
ncbi:MAG: adenylosuccinate synthase [Chloroflexi bacterium]|nr:adenylosuccinate synthase [Chloroflexota bacterium]